MSDEKSPKSGPIDNDFDAEPLLSVLDMIGLETKAEATDPGATPDDQDGIKAKDAIAPSSVEIGTECQVKKLYEGPAKCSCCINWVEQYPDDLRESIETKEDSKAKAIVARIRKSHKQGKPLVLDSIVIQHAGLKAFLRDLLGNYKGITPELKNVVLSAPFTPFFFRWERFKILLSQQEENCATSKPYIKLLYDLLRPEIEPVIEEVNDCSSQRGYNIRLLVGSVSADARDLHQKEWSASYLSLRIWQDC
jgi:hypothetical protein